MFVTAWIFKELSLLKKKNKKHVLDFFKASSTQWCWNEWDNVFKNLFICMMRIITEKYAIIILF